MKKKWICKDPLLHMVSFCLVSLATYKQMLDSVSVYQCICIYYLIIFNNNTYYYYYYYYYLLLLFLIIICYCDFYDFYDFSCVLVLICLVWSS